MVLNGKAVDNRDPKARFTQVFSIVEAEALAFCKQQGIPEDALARFQHNLEYNTPGGKLNRGLSVIETLSLLYSRPLTDDEYEQAAILGWSVELLQAFFLVADDIMDASTTRRGQPCWYQVEEIGLLAINDSAMLESCIYFLLKKHFRKEPCYVHLLELFHDVTFQTLLGQLVDTITASDEVVDLSKFSLQKHHLIVTLKTAYYSFYLPVALAMRLAGISDETAYDQARDILVPLGEYFQVQDDYLDCFGAPGEIGKVGTDILDNKCSWLINVALSACTPDQRVILDANYGRKDSACEARVKAIYKELDLPKRYAAYEQAAYESVNDMIDAVPEKPDGLKREVFTAFVQKIYKRTK